MIPSELTRTHVMRALGLIQGEGVPQKRASRGYCLIHMDLHFAPKYVVSESCRLFLRQELRPEDFSGGDPTNNVLRSLGFVIKECTCGGLARSRGA